MPIQHTVVFRLVHEPGSDAETAFLDNAETTLTGIPGVHGFAIHRQIGTKNDLAWQFTMDFDDQDAYDAYTDHPTHVAFVRDRWQSEVAAFEEYDFIAR